MTEPIYRRVLLKLSGEALQGEQDFGISPSMLADVAAQLREVRDAGVQLAIVVGGGNLFRGIAGAASGMDRVRADHMGMLATCINAIAIKDALIGQGVPCEVMSGVALGPFARTFVRDDAVDALERGGVVVFAAGTGNPYFSTDTASSLRALEIGAEAMLKATKVDGVYDRDPVKHSDAVRFDRLTYDDVVRKKLRVLDLTAAAMCRDAGLVIRVFDLFAERSIMRVLLGEEVGTTITGDP